MTDNKRKLAIITEIRRRKLLKNYEHDFEKFASDQIKIITKDAGKGFIPFKFNPAQKRLNNLLEEQLKQKGKVRALILKARQQGISTFCTARTAWKTYFTPNARSVVMAHDSATSDALFNMSKNLIDKMEDSFKPQLIASNAKEIKFEHNNAGYRLYTAGSPEAGRGTTPTIAHLSEVAFWTFDEKILAGLFQGISQADGTEVILESTANGAKGEFYRLWKTAEQGYERGDSEYIPIFLPWFITDEYRREAPENFEPDAKELSLIEEHGLDFDQLYWRRLKIAESGEKKFVQEYPSYAEEAFLVTGSSVFDMKKLSALEPVPYQKRMRLDLDSKFWEDTAEGDIEIYDYPTHKQPYVIGADVALGVGKDYSASVVLDKDRRIVAVYRNNRIDPSKFGDFLFYLGRYYNNALLAVESNSMGIATLQKLDDMGYINLYRQTKIANISNQEGERLGFRTTTATKSTIIGNLKNAIENDDIYVPSIQVIQELKDYIVNDNGKAEAAPGCHDDTVMALAIGLEVLRTHYDRIVTDKVPWNQKWNTFKEDNTAWI
jgi:hypothetical protein